MLRIHDETTRRNDDVSRKSLPTYDPMYKFNTGVDKKTATLMCSELQSNFKKANGNFAVVGNVGNSVSGHDDFKREDDIFNSAASNPFLPGGIFSTELDVMREMTFTKDTNEEKLLLI